jgi:2-polyprenyl-3-methyl-5-hydroxy-6-metoxy-1,4-benzoquinol methylase
MMLAYCHEEHLVMEAALLCPICGVEGMPLAKRFSINSTPQYMSCVKCKSIYASKKATQKELLAHYSTYYSTENLQIPDVAKNSLAKTVSTFSKFRTINNTICDIGFGAGALLEAAEALSWECAGSEYSADAIAIGRSRGWEVHEGDMTLKDLPGPYDVVTIIETLEHVQDPRELLMCASVRIRSGGLLYGTTPNAGSINALLLKQEWSVITFPEHPILISKKALRGLLIETGFTNISIKSRGINPYDLIAKYKDKLNPGERSNKPDLGRVDFGYNLNATFSRNLIMRTVKSMIMALLGKTNIGDSLVFSAVKI